MFRRRRSVPLSVSLSCLIVSLLLTGCLKTRSQLKQDGDTDAPPPPVKSEPTQVQDTALPNGQYAIDELKTEVTRLGGRIDDLEHNQKQAPQGPMVSTDDFKKLGDRVTELEQAQAQMLEVLKKLQESAPAPENTQAFENAKESFDDGDFEGAVAALNDYLKNPKAKKLEDATLMRADAYFSLKEYKKAILDYSKFPEKFTRSKFLPHALLRIGQSFDALGMHDDAKGFYQELAEKFPKSPEAKKAHSKLK